MRNLWTHVTICRIFGCLLSSFCYLGQCYLEWRLSSFEWYFTSLQFTFAFSALMLLAGDRNGIQPVKNEWWGTGMVICLKWDADFHMTRLMPLPLTVSCFSKIQIDFTFLIPANPGSPGKGPLNVCVCVSHLYNFIWSVYNNNMLQNCRVLDGLIQVQFMSKIYVELLLFICLLFMQQWNSSSVSGSVAFCIDVVVFRSQ